MIKDVFTLSKSSWHARYMKWMWNIHPEEFTHMCPYFWISFFSVVLSPVLVLFRLLAKLILYIDNKVSTTAAQKSEKWQNEQMGKMLMDEAYMEKCILEWIGGKRKWSPIIMKFSDMGGTNPGSEEYIIHRKFITVYIKATEKHNKAFSNKTDKQRIVLLNKYMEPFMKFVMLPFIILLLLCGLFMVVNSGKSQISVLEFVVMIALIILCIAVVIGASYGIAHLFLKLIGSEKLMNKVKKPFRGLGNIIKNACPAVKWND